MKILGVMTGTSCDGIDLVCVDFSSPAPCLLWSASRPFHAPLRKKILTAQKPNARVSLKEFLVLERDFSLWMGNTILSVLKRAPAKQKKFDPDFLAVHGQTLAHFPKEREGGVSLQMLDPSIIAKITKKTVISHFRQGDLAAGGEGAPLVPLFQKLVLALSNQKLPVAFHNLGGISNLAVISKHEVLAFDTGPANLWIDEATAFATNGKRRFDEGGILAAQGSPDPIALRKLMRHPFLKMPPPKSTGRDDFDFSLLRSSTSSRGKDLVATATEFTAISIADAYKRFVLKKHPSLTTIYFAGGGAYNSFLLRRIAAHLKTLRIRTCDELGIDPQMMEAQAFAFLGAVSLAGLSVGGKWTNKKGFAPPGWITPGENWSYAALLLSRRLPKLIQELNSCGVF